MRKRSNCPACQDANFSSRLEWPYTHPSLPTIWFAEPLRGILSEKIYKICKCTKCGLFFQELVPEEKDLPAIYDTVGLPSAHLRPISECSHMAEDIILIRLLFARQRPVVLDFGMHHGYWSTMALAYDCDSWGSDVNPQSPEVARQRGIRFVQPGEIPRSTFDFINADQCFEHLADPLPVLKLLAQGLKPGGIIKLSTPADKHIEEKIARAKTEAMSPEDFSREFDSLSPLVHLNLFAKKSLLTLAQNAGLDRYQVPLSLSYSAMTLFNTPRQWNRNLYSPFKRWRSQGTWQYFRKHQE